MMTVLEEQKLVRFSEILKTEFTRDESFIHGLVAFLADKSFISFTTGAQMLNKTNEEFATILRRHNIVVSEELMSFLEEMEDIKNETFFN